MLAYFRPSTTIFYFTSRRTFTSTAASHAQKAKESTRRVPSKKAQALKNKRKTTAWIRQENSGERLPLCDAIQVLRAVEVMRPFTSYELLVRIRLLGGTPPKGRFELPHKMELKTDELILVFAEGKQAEEAKKAGAHVVGGPELIEDVLNSKLRPTNVFCAPELLKTITPPLGRFLGPKGLMPSVRRGTVTDDLPGLLRKVAGAQEWRASKDGKISVPVARMSFTPSQVQENVRAFLDNVRIVTGNKKMPVLDPRSQEAKRVIPIGQVLLGSTQGPSIKLSDP